MGNIHDAHPYDALVKMANEIAANIAPGKNPQQTAEAMLNHLTRFWSRSMKSQIIDCLDTEDNQLEPTAVEAIKLLKQSRD